MKRFKVIVSIFLGVQLICFSFCNEALAYLDPGTGSFIIQMAIASIVGGLFAIKIYYRKIKEFLMGLFSKNKRS
jgi:hypothetical protein